MTSGTYGRADLARALAGVGLREGDVVFSHSNVGFFGVPEGGATASNVVETVLGAFRDVLGTSGTLVVPTFTYSFALGEPFDPANTPSTAGLLTERVRQMPHALRSSDALFSVAAIGPRAAELTANVPAQCFGPGSFWDRFLAADGIVCNLNLDSGSTFLHFVERTLGVPYRYDKLFEGDLVTDGVAMAAIAIHHVYDLSAPRTGPLFEALDVLARERGVSRTERVGRGAVVGHRARAIFDLVATTLPGRPWLLTVADGDPAPPAPPAPPVPMAATHVHGAARPMDVLAALAPLARHLASPGAHRALATLGDLLSFEVIGFPSGTAVAGDVVPESWTCRRAEVQTAGGSVLLAVDDSTLSVASYSRPFGGRITRDELRRHLAVGVGAAPYRTMRRRPGWTLAVGADVARSLSPDEYDVTIEASFSRGWLRIAEATVMGTERDEILLFTHFGHAGTANEGLSGIVVGIAALRALRERGPARHGYRLVVTPPEIGPAAWLQRSRAADRAVAALFLDGLGRDDPFRLDVAGDDKWVTRWARAAGPGVVRSGAPLEEDSGRHAFDDQLPHALLYRGPDPASAALYPGHHTAADDLAHCDAEALERSVAMVLRIIDGLEDGPVR